MGDEVDIFGGIQTDAEKDVRGAGTTLRGGSAAADVGLRGAGAAAGHRTGHGARDPARSIGSGGGGGATRRAAFSASVRVAHRGRLGRQRDQLKAENAQLKRNISSLYATAKAEIQRKDRVISELRGDAPR